MVSSRYSPWTIESYECWFHVCFSGSHLTDLRLRLVINVQINVCKFVRLIGNVFFFNFVLIGINFIGKV